MKGTSKGDKAGVSAKKEQSLQKGKAKGDGKLAPNTKPGNAKSFGQGKATDNRSAKKGN